MAFKMKSGSPFQRNFGVGKSPIKHIHADPKNTARNKAEEFSLVGHNARHKKNPDWKHGEESEKFKKWEESLDSDSPVDMKSPVKQTKYFGKPKEEEEEIPTMDFLKQDVIHAAESTGMGKSNIELEMEADARDNEQKLKDFKENNKVEYDKLVEEWKKEVGDQFSTSLGYQDLYQHSGPKQPFPIPKWMGGEYMGKWSTSGQAKIHKDKQASLDSFILSKI